MSLRPSASRVKITTNKPLDSTFGSLPYEMLEEIFNYLEPVKRQKLRLVCRSWNKSISHCYPVKMRLFESSNWETMSKTNARLISAFIPNMRNELKVQMRENLDSVCTRLNALELSGDMLLGNVVPLLNKCTSLKKLALNNLCPVKASEAAFANDAEMEADLNRLKASQSFENWLPKLRSFRLYFGDLDLKHSYEKKSLQTKLYKFVADMMRDAKLTKLKINWDPDPMQFYSTCSIFSYLLGIQTGFPRHYRDLEFLIDLIERNKSTIQKAELNVENKVSMPGENVHLWFYAQTQTRTFDKPRVKKFSGIHSLHDYFQYSDRSSINFLLLQEQLTTLELEIDETIFGESSWLLKYFLTVLPQAILKNAVTLTKVKILFPPPPVRHHFLYPDNIMNINLIDSLAKCTRLESLTLSAKSLTPQELLPFMSRVTPTFKDLSRLPVSLKYFCTSFSIETQTKTILELDLTNLSNLETFIFTGTNLFIFNDVKSKKTSLPDFEVFLAKLSTLKKIVLKVGSYRWEQAPDGGLRKAEPVYTSTPELISAFQKDILNDEVGSYLHIYPR